jgi:diadenylate cyclase
VIVQGDRVAAAACFLPLTVNPALLRRQGTRHRAAIGITEETDALAVVVSEETRQISIASRGDIEPDVSLDRVRERLSQASVRNRKQDAVADRQWVEP